MAMFNVRIQYSSESAINIKSNTHIITYNSPRDGINEHNRTIKITKYK